MRYIVVTTDGKLFAPMPTEKAAEARCKAANAAAEKLGIATRYAVRAA